MEKLQVKITFKSGRELYLTSNDYYKGQFREYAACLLRNAWRVGDDVAYNIPEIEQMEEVE